MRLLLSLYLATICTQTTQLHQIWQVQPFTKLIQPAAFNFGSCTTYFLKIKFSWWRPGRGQHMLALSSERADLKTQCKWHSSSFLSLAQWQRPISSHSEGQRRRITSSRLNSEILSHYLKGLGHSSVGACLPRIHKSLSSILSTEVLLELTVSKNPSFPFHNISSLCNYQLASESHVVILRADYINISWPTWNYVSAQENPGLHKIYRPIFWTKVVCMGFG